MSEDRLLADFEKEAIKLLKDARIDWESKRLNITAEKQLIRLAEETAKKWGEKTE